MKKEIEDKSSDVMLDISIKQHQELVIRHQKLKELSTVKDDYISLLVSEIDSLIGLANVHGWKSQNVKKGEELRAKIKALTDERINENDD